MYYLDTADPVNHNNPLLSGLTGWWSTRVPGRPAPSLNAMDWHDLTGRHRVFTANAPSYTDTTGAFGLTNLPGAAGLVNASGSHSSGSDGANPINNSDHIFPSASQATILILYRHRDTTLRGAALIGTLVQGGSFESRITLGAPFSDGNVYWDYGGATEGTTRLSFAYTKDTAWHWWAATVGGGYGMRVYRDGLLLGSNSGTPSRTLNASHISFGADQFWGTDNADVAELFTFGRTLSPDEVYEWYIQSADGHPNTHRRFSRRPYPLGAAAGGGFQAAWARRANVVLSPGIAG